jgi:hypothetical protein
MGSRIGLFGTERHASERLRRGRRDARRNGPVESFRLCPVCADVWDPLLDEDKGRQGYGTAICPKCDKGVKNWWSNEA